MDYEVVVVGGGISGSVAAIASSRAGVKTLVVERYGFLGGMLTSAGVGPMMTFHAGDTQVINGITGELIERLKRKGLSPGHIPDAIGYTYTVTPFDPEGMKRELEAMLIEAGGEVLFHSMLADVVTNRHQLLEITICTKSGLEKLTGHVYVDATGDADLAAHSGVAFTKGSPTDGLPQPQTMKLRLYGVDIDEVRRYVKSHPEEFPILKGRVDLVDTSPRLSVAGFVSSLKAARQKGEISFEREHVLFFETNNPGEVIVNTSRISGLDPTVPKQLSRAEIEGRRQADEIYRFLKKYIPGFQTSVVHSTGPQVGVRSSRQIVGLYTVTKEDILSGRRFSDAVVCNGYPIDIHGSGDDTHHEFLPWGGWYTIPYRALVNSEIVNLITVGRCISGEFEAQAAFRTTPGAGAIGHAGGCAAAIAARSYGDCTAINATEVQRLLISQGAFLPDEAMGTYRHST